MAFAWIINHGRLRRDFIRNLLLGLPNRSPPTAHPMWCQRGSVHMVIVPGFGVSKTLVLQRGDWLEAN